MSRPARFAAALFVGALCLVVEARAADAVPESYAVLSSIGDSLTIVTYKPAVGSNLDANDRQVVSLGDSQFDRLAVGLAGQAIRRSTPGAALVRVVAPASTPFDGTDEQLGGPGRAGLLEAIRPQLKGDVHYLVVIGKHHADARLRMAHSTIGSGKLIGLGFYLDNLLRVTDSRNGQRGTGFIAPYAYLSATLIDLRTGEIVRSESARESMSVGTVRSETATRPWEALTAEQKIGMLNTLVRRAIDDMVPRLVAPA